MFNKVLIVATSRKTRGGITSVIKTYENGPQWPAFRCHWIQTHRDGPSWRKMIYFISALFDYIVRLPFCGLVHVHISLKTTARRKIIFVRLAKLLRKKIIVHLHCGSQIDQIWNDRYDYIFGAADVSLVLSESLKQKVREHVSHDADVRVCYNPCPKVSFHPVESKKKTVLFSGTLCQGKGYQDLIKAFSLIADKYPDWTLAFAGNGEISKGRAMAEEYHISEQTIFHGWLSGEAKAILFRESSVFCLPSYAEGFPMAVLDAWAYGLPVITTPVGGIPDVAVDGRNMLVFNPGDIESLASRMDLMMSDENLRRSISAESVRLAHTLFDVDTINRQLGDLYAELLNRK